MLLLYPGFSVLHVFIHFHHSFISIQYSVGFLGRKNPQHAFLPRGSKAVGPRVVDLRHVKDPKIYVEVGI